MLEGVRPVNPVPLLRAQGLTKVFETRAGPVRAVDALDLTLRRGETMGLVGESGSGKSTVARLLLRLVEPSAGDIEFDGHDLLKLEGQELRRIRRRMQIVFQNPYGSLLPHYTAIANVGEPLRLHGMNDPDQRRGKAMELLEMVGIPLRLADLFPQQFSGGQQQRIAIARALALQPDLLICDEPTSALDVSIQAQILNLFREVQDRLSITMLFISHNLAVIEHLATEVMVMRRGKVVEAGSTESVFEDPRHSYTRSLLAAVLSVDTNVPTRPLPEDSEGEDGETMDEVAPGHFVRTPG